LGASAQDNYVWILQESGSGKIAVVDPSEAAPVAKALDERYVGILIGSTVKDNSGCMQAQMT